jgi:heat shock protein HspQ
MSKTSIAKFKIGQVTRHRVHAFRGVVFDVDPQYADGAVSYEHVHLIEGRQRQDQPFYYLFAENEQAPYIAYVSEQNLLPIFPTSRSIIPRWMTCSSSTKAAAIGSAGRG